MALSSLSNHVPPPLVRALRAIAAQVVPPSALLTMGQRLPAEGVRPDRYSTPVSSAVIQQSPSVKYLPVPSSVPHASLVAASTASTLESGRYADDSRETSGRRFVTPRRATTNSPLATVTSG